MRKSTTLIVAAALALAPLQSYSQSSTLQMLKPSPVGIALTLGQWLMKDRKKVYFIRVQGEGYSYEEAKQQAFATAVDQAVGAVVLSETEVSNRRVIRNDLIKYSAGFVDDFRVTSQETLGNITRLEIDVWVSSSKISDRLLGGSKQEGLIDGDRHSAQLETFQRSTVAGDRQLQVVLNDFPKRSFVTKAGKSRIEIQPDRSALLAVDFTAHWDHRYLEALNESLKNLKPKTPMCGVHSTGHIIPVQSKKVMVRIKKNPTGWGFVDWNCYHYDDPNFYNQVEQRLGKPLFLIGRFYSHDKTVLQTGCFDVDLTRMNAVGYNLIDFRGDEYWYGRVGIPVSEYSVKDYHSVEFEIVADPAICRAMAAR